MTRLIDADALYMNLVKMKDFGELTAKKAIRIVENAPTVDAVPVIRCKDCKCFGNYESYGHYCENDNFVTTGEEFCSWAERKEK